MTIYNKLTRILKFIAIRDLTMYGHFHRVSKVSKLLAEEYGIKDQEKLETIKQATFLHDVGKIFIPDDILLKENTLCFGESELMRKHVNMGAEIISYLFENPLLSKIVRQHHEAFDGSGYPQGISGEKICIEARICNLTDSFDTMYCGRCYARPRPFAETIKEINRCSGKQFDPQLVDIFNYSKENIRDNFYSFKKHRKFRPPPSQERLDGRI